jgi:hypothetical protein
MTFLSTLPNEILFSTFKLLDRPSKVSLSLTSPQMLYLFASYYDLDQYRSSPHFARKMGVPETVSWQGSRAQGAIIRYIAIPSGHTARRRQFDGLLFQPADDGDYRDEEITYDQHGNVCQKYKPYEKTTEGSEEVIIQAMLGDWLRRKCGVEGGVVFCMECYRFMRLRREDGRENLWGQSGLSMEMQVEYLAHKSNVLTAFYRCLRQCRPCLSSCYGFVTDVSGIAKDSIRT